MEYLSVLVVDDEFLVREGLRSTIDWNALGFELVAEAEDGAQALALARRLRPDLILTDIRMPKMDGLELIKRLRDESPSTKVVVLSAYTDFEYVREAMQLWGALDYIPKLSMKAADLARVLETVRFIIEKERTSDSGTTSRSDARRRFFAYLLEGDADLSDAHLQSLGLGIDARHLWLAVSARYTKRRGARDGQSARDRDLIAGTFAELAEETMHELRLAGNAFPWRDFHCALILDAGVPAAGSRTAASRTAGSRASASPATGSGAAESRAPRAPDEAYIRKLCREIHHRASERIEIDCTFGVDFTASGPVGTRRSFENAASASAYGFFGRGPVVAASEVPPRELQIGILTPVLREQVREAALRAAFAEIGAAVRATLVSAGTSRFADPLLVLRDLNEIDSLLASSLTDLGVPSLPGRQDDRFDTPNAQARYSLDTTPTLSSAVAAFETRVRACTDALAAFRSRRYSAPVRNVMSFIESHVRDSIRLATLADSVGMSEAYLSHLFKKETGMGIIDYANGRKIDIARSHLIHSDANVNETAAHLGFQNVSYFSRLFKRVTGRTPQSFKQESGRADRPDEADAPKNSADTSKNSAWYGPGEPNGRE